jgi:hypothetical protein
VHRCVLQMFGMQKTGYSVDKKIRRSAFPEPGIQPGSPYACIGASVPQWTHFILIWLFTLRYFILSLVFPMNHSSNSGISLLINKLKNKTIYESVRLSDQVPPLSTADSSMALLHEVENLKSESRRHESTLNRVLEEYSKFLEIFGNEVYKNKQKSIKLKILLKWKNSLHSPPSRPISRGLKELSIQLDTPPPIPISQPFSITRSRINRSHIQ